MNDKHKCNVTYSKNRKEYAHLPREKSPKGNPHNTLKEYIITYVSIYIIKSVNPSWVTCTWLTVLHSCFSFVVTFNYVIVILTISLDWLVSNQQSCEVEATVLTRRRAFVMWLAVYEACLLCVVFCSLVSCLEYLT